MDEDIKKLNEKAEGYAKDLQKSIDELKKVIVGQDDVIEKLIIALIADGHIFLEGVPGLAKTLMIKTLASTLDAKFRRLQFTPDLLPADILGTKIYNHQNGSFSTKKGPIFANFILADEINRAPPKVQSALLESMQERQVTISGDTFKLDTPFLVLATQNPLETEGTYRLPEAQVDRFMFKILIDYPTKEEESMIIEKMTKGEEYKINKVLTPEKILKIQKFNKSIYCDQKVVDYVVDIVDATRSPKSYGLSIEKLIDYGASPRASIWMILAAKAHALLQGRGYVLPEDIQIVAYSVLRHRIIISFEAEAEDISTDKIIDMILDKVKVP